MKILVPTDFSPTSTAACELAVRIARLGNWEVIFHHAYTAASDWAPAPLEMTGGPAPAGRAIDRVRARLQALEERYPDVLVRTQLSTYETIDELIEAAQAEGVDWIVAATRGGKDLSNKIMGSDTQRMIRVATCPVIIIREAAAFPWRNLLLVTDLSEDITPALEQLLPLADLMHAQLHLGYINSPMAFRSTAEAEARMREYCTPFATTDIRLHVYDHQRIDAGIRELAGRVAADAVGLITHHHGNWFRLFSQSLTETIALDSPIPVISLHL